MVAGFLAGYLPSGSYRDALLYGICTGSASAFSDELATKDAVQALLHQHPDLIR
jgi:1-phosphofructokinase